MSNNNKNKKSKKDNQKNNTKAEIKESYEMGIKYYEEVEENQK